MEIEEMGGEKRSLKILSQNQDAGKLNYRNLFYLE